MQFIKAVTKPAIAQSPHPRSPECSLHIDTQVLRHCFNIILNIPTRLTDGYSTITVFFKTMMPIGVFSYACYIHSTSTAQRSLLCKFLPSCCSYFLRTFCTAMLSDIQPTLTFTSQNERREEATRTWGAQIPHFLTVININLVSHRMS